MSEAFGTFTPEQLALTREGLRLFNQQKYWECHEALEDLWLEDRNDPARNVYWAIIQVAAALIHYRDGNLIGARGMLNKSREKFRRCREQKILNKEMTRVLDWSSLEALVNAVPEEEPRLEDFAPLFDFKFNLVSGE